MDGIPVKISEKYKPPRKITLPASVLNKLNTEIKFEKVPENYDFSLEHYVVEQMAKLREQKQQFFEKNGHKKQTDIKTLEKSAQYLSLKQSSSPTTADSTILTPIPLQPEVYTKTAAQQFVSGINLSDFENDTSSPFDFVELKTLNDMEELASVLGSSSRWTHCEQQTNGVTSVVWNKEVSTQPPMNYIPIESSVSLSPRSEEGEKRILTEKKDTESYNILLDLQKRLDERKEQGISLKQKEQEISLKQAECRNERIERNSKSIEESCSKPLSREISRLPNPVNLLPVPGQVLARRLAEMGFPLGRAARAVQTLGVNEAKVIEFLLMVQNLEERGHPGDRSERALLQCGMSLDAALDFIKSIEQILRLGFEEEQVIAALESHDSDRDEALDSLIS